MKVAYCTAIYPCRSEKFLLREMSCLRSHGVELFVWALLRPPTVSASEINMNDLEVRYRPARVSAVAAQAIGWMCFHHPLCLAVLLGEIARLAVRSPLLAARLLANLHTVAFFAREARIEGVTAVHGYFLNLPGLVAMGVSILAGLPLTVAGHGRDAFVENGAVHFLARRASRVILCHASAAEMLAGRLNGHLRSKLVVMHHGLDPQHDADWAGADTDPLSDEQLIVAAGRFVPKKGFSVLLRAMACLRGHGVRCQLVLAGDGPQADRLHALCHELALDDRVTWPGWLSEVALRQLLSGAAMVVVPSVTDVDGDRDGIPNIVLEAWASRVPVVASELPGLQEAITHEVHGLLVAPGDDQQLTEAIERLLGDSSLRYRLVNQGWRRLRAEFNPQVNGQRIVRLLEKAHYV